MDNDLPQHAIPEDGGLEARIAAAIAPTLGAMGYELVRVQVQGKERPTVQIMADRADGSLIGVGDCEAISHAVGAVLDVDDPFPGVWNLEVSSAGIDRPLTRTKDWVRFAGHVATAEMHVPQDGRRRWKGRILSADDDNVVLKPEEGGEAVTLPRSAIRRAKLVLTDELIAATAAPSPEGDEVEEAEDAPKLAPLRWRNPADTKDKPRPRGARGPGRFAKTGAAATRPPSERN